MCFFGWLMAVLHSLHLEAQSLQHLQQLCPVDLYVVQEMVNICTAKMVLTTHRLHLNT